MGSLLGGDMPKVETPPTLPQEDSQAVEAAKKKKAAEVKARSGRSSTILSNVLGGKGNNSLGG